METTEKVRLVGWREGFRRTAFAKLLRDNGWVFVDALRTTTRFVEGAVVDVPRAAVDEARSLGAIVEGDPG